ncbi:hypothetical protein [Nocardioides sp. cx-173]|uniref:hypothetical protein n=1 Tax=Nocardioides sp. cx-173 TaxID=2898796 RepID=UPI001E340404|nr:hypothetical protein [Nocardioides sp. cx-173]MCD4523864.1 hypothetical protein [Nocardioides sp. cx-173]UGB41816.1 hypothetical protein LQ940_21010 [Nocardioides sp. cx-173]
MQPRRPHTGTAPTVLGSLSTGNGTGALRTPAATIIATGQLSIQQQGTGADTLWCQFRVDGVTAPTHSYDIDEDFSMVPVGAVVPVAAGTHDVSLVCNGSADAGNVQVSVVAVPR